MLNISIVDEDVDNTPATLLPMHGMKLEQGEPPVVDHYLYAL